jgi:hypothetical protein
MSGTIYFWVALPVLAVASMGCNIVAPVAYAIGPEPKIAAIHIIENKPTVVFVDDRLGRVSPSRLVRTLADQTSEMLLDMELVETVYRPADAIAFVKQNDRSDNVVSNQDIAEAVGADQLVYIEIMRFDLTAGGYSGKPTAVLNVKVLDITDSKIVFPDPESGQMIHQLLVELPTVDIELFRSLSGRSQIKEQLAIESGDAVARLFYEYEPRILGDRLQAR